MDNSSFFNIEFYRTLSSILIGGFISVFSIFLVEFLKNRKEKLDKKRLLYNQILTTTNQIGRLESMVIDLRLSFRFHKRYFEITRDELWKEQAEYNLKSCNEAVDKLIDKYEVLDGFSIDYKIYNKVDKLFDDFMSKVEKREGKVDPDYDILEDLNSLTIKFNIDFKNYRKDSENYWLEYRNNLEKHINKKLL